MIKKNIATGHLLSVIFDQIRNICPVENLLAINTNMNMDMLKYFNLSITLTNALVYNDTDKNLYLLEFTTGCVFL